MVRAAEQRANLSWLDVRVGCDQPADRLRSRGHFHRPRARHRLEGAAVDIRDGIAEPVDPDDEAGHRGVLDHGNWNIEAGVIGGPPAPRGPPRAPPPPRPPPRAALP